MGVKVSVEVILKLLSITIDYEWAFTEKEADRFIEFLVGNFRQIYVEVLNNSYLRMFSSNFE